MRWPSWANYKILGAYGYNTFTGTLIDLYTGEFDFDGFSFSQVGYGWSFTVGGAFGYHQSPVAQTNGSKSSH